MANLTEEVVALSSELETVGSPPLDMVAILARVAARTGNAQPTNSLAAKHARKSKKRTHNKRAADDTESTSSDTPPPSASSTANGSASAASTQSSTAAASKEPPQPAQGKDSAKEGSSSKKDKSSKNGTAATETVRIRSIRQRLAIALPLFEKALEFGGEAASLRDVQRSLITELLARYGVEQYVPVVSPAYDDGGQLEAAPPLSTTPPPDDRGRVSKDGTTLAVPAAAATRTRSRSPLKKGKRDDAPPSVSVSAPTSPASSDATTSTTTTTTTAATTTSIASVSTNGTTAATTSATTAHANGASAATDVPRRMMLQLGVPASVFREQAKQNPALLFALLHFRKFTQTTLLDARPRERRNHDYDYLGSPYATGRPPIVIDLSNLAKTERDIVRRRQSDEQMQREKIKRDMKDLEAMRRSGGGGGGGGSGGGSGGGAGSASGLSSSKKSASSSASGNNGSGGGSGSGAGGGNGSGNGSSMSGMATLSMTGSAAALFSR